MPPNVANRTGCQHQREHGDEVTIDHPLQPRNTDLQVPRNRRQRNVEHVVAHVGKRRAEHGGRDDRSTRARLKRDPRCTVMEAGRHAGQPAIGWGSAHSTIFLDSFQVGHRCLHDVGCGLARSVVRRGVRCLETNVIGRIEASSVFVVFAEMLPVGACGFLGSAGPMPLGSSCLIDQSGPGGLIDQSGPGGPDGLRGRGTKC